MRGLFLFIWLWWIISDGLVRAQHPADGSLGLVNQLIKQIGTDQYGDPLPQNALARIGTLRLKASSNISSVVFSIDGKTLFTCASDSKGVEGIACWDTASGKLLKRIPYMARCLTLSPDGKTLAAVSSGNNELSLIDVATARILHQLRAKTEGVSYLAAAFSTDGATIASCGMGGVLLWDVKTGHLRQHLYDWSAARGLAWSPNGKMLAGVGNGSGLLGDVTTGKEIWKVTVGDQFARCSVAFAPDGSVVAFGDNDGLIRIMEPISGKEIRRFTGHTSAVAALAFTPDSKHLASGGCDKTVRIWNLKTAKEKNRLQLRNRAQASALAWSPNGATLASTSTDQTVQLWSMATGKELLPVSGHREYVMSLSFASDGRTLASGDFGGHLLLTDLAKMKAQHSFDGHFDPISAVAFTPDGKRFVSACWGSKLILWDRQTGKELLSFKGHADRVYALAFSPDGKTLASAGNDSTIRLWDSTTGQEIKRMEGGEVWKWVTSLVFSQDGRVLASGRQDGIVRLCDVVSGKEIHKLEGHKEDVTSLARSPNGRFLLSGSEDGTVRVWEWDSGREVCRFIGSDRRIRSVNFSPDGRTIVAGDESAVVFLWELASEKLLARYRGHNEEVYCVAFAPDGRSVASGSRDFTILLWDVTRQDGQRAASSMTEAELWESLAAVDPIMAHQALWRMVRSPNVSVPLLQKTMRPAVQSITKKQIARLVADLNASDFDIREKATKELSIVGELAVPQLRKALEVQPALELKRRAERILEHIFAQKPDPSRMRLGRALTVLEQINTQEAREVLGQLAKGAEGNWLTIEATESLQRLDVQARIVTTGRNTIEFPR